MTQYIKQHWALFLVLIGGILLQPQHLPAQQPEGESAFTEFLGYELGMPRDSMLPGSLVKRGKSQKLIRWDVLPEYLAFGDIALKQVKLFFWEGNLHSIEVKAQGDEGQKLREWAENAWGEGTKKDAMGYSYSWEASRSQAFLEQNLVTKDVMLTLLDDKVHRSYYKFMYERNYGQ